VPGVKTPAAREFIAALEQLADPKKIPEIQRYFHVDANARSAGNKFLGVSFGKIFAVAKQFAAMPLVDVENLLESPYYEVRMGAVSIMDFQARAKRTTPPQRKALFDLYIRRHDRINNWDLVDLAAKPVIGQYLADKPRAILRKLARSKDMWERRTALYACLWFIMKQKSVDDTEAVCELLINEKEEIIQKALGGLVRCIGIDRPRLHAFLQKHAATMPRVALRYAIEKLSPADKKKYMAMG
jgi:3-methyladenine DNA glycosylase AlkD